MLTTFEIGGDHCNEIHVEQFLTDDKSQKAKKIIVPLSEWGDFVNSIKEFDKKIEPLKELKDKYRKEYHELMNKKENIKKEILKIEKNHKQECVIFINKNNI